MRQFDRAALFIEACLKYGVMEANDSSNILSETSVLRESALLLASCTSQGVCVRGLNISSTFGHTLCAVLVLELCFVAVLYFSSMNTETFSSDCTSIMGKCRFSKCQLGL